MSARVVDVSAAARLLGLGPTLHGLESGAATRRIARLDEADAAGGGVVLSFDASTYTASTSFMRGLLGDDPGRYSLAHPVAEALDCLRGVQATVASTDAPPPAEAPATGLTPAERGVLDLSAALWNAFCGLPAGAAHDADDFQHHLHALQRIVALRVARRVDPATWTQHP